MKLLRLAAVGVASAALAACAPAASDSDGEIYVAGPMEPAPAKVDDPVRVVVDTDLAPDDLAALTLLVRHPDVEVVAVTVPQTGILGCVGLGLINDLFDGLQSPAPPVACGDSSRGADGILFPQAWSMGAMESSGLAGEHDPTSLTPVPSSAAELIGRLARRHTALHVVALGPLTEVARTLRDHPRAYRKLAGVTTMAGNATAPSQAHGVAEWNAAADPARFAEVLAGPVPVTVVPEGPVPAGAPDGLAGPVVGGLGRVPGFESPAYWDLATAGVFVDPSTATWESGDWSADVTGDRGRLRRTGHGTVRVVTSLDADALDRVYDAAFG